MYAKGFKLFWCQYWKTKYNCFGFCLNYVRLLVQISFDSNFLQYLVKTLVSLLPLLWLENNSRFAAINSDNLSWEICSEITLG
jgi:hypothetical protein